MRDAWKGEREGSVGGLIRGVRKLEAIHRSSTENELRFNETTKIKEEQEKGYDEVTRK